MGSNLNSILSATLCVLLLGACVAQAQSSDPTPSSGQAQASTQGGAPHQEAVDRRKGFMRSFGAAMGPSNAIAKGEAQLTPETIDLIRTAHANAQQLASDPSAHFPEGSNIEGSRAKAEIWQDWDQFQQNAQNLEAELSTLLQLAEAGDQQGFSAQVQNVGGTCGACHSGFRE